MRCRWNAPELNQGSCGVGHRPSHAERVSCLLWLTAWERDFDNHHVCIIASEPWGMRRYRVHTCAPEMRCGRHVPRRHSSTCSRALQHALGHMMPALQRVHAA